MAGIDVTDFVMVRFATAPYFFMRKAHMNAAPWLERRGIRFTSVRTMVYFNLPDHMEVYTKITPELCDKLAPLATEIKRRSMAVSFSALGKVRQPLTVDEFRYLAEANIPIII